MRRIWAYLMEFWRSGPIAEPEPALSEPYGSTSRRPAIVKKKGPKISLLIPFSSQNLLRVQTFKWLLQYWKAELPEAEIIIGHSYGPIFCKGIALNDAARRARGEILVVLDADAYLPGAVIARCANRILEELPHHLWYVPYRHLYRLTKKATNLVLQSDPAHPHRFPSPPPPWARGRGHHDKSGYGHRFGAMITIMPREALDALGCFDERFKGWGGEDVAILRALDTLYGLHKTTKNDVLHLWHPYIGRSYKTRKWQGQEFSNANSRLAMLYHKATGHPEIMRELVTTGCRRIQTDSLF